MVLHDASRHRFPAALPQCRHFHLHLTCATILGNFLMLLCPPPTIQAPDTARHSFQPSTQSSTRASCHPDSSCSTGRHSYTNSTTSIVSRLPQPTISTLSYLTRDRRISTLNCNHRAKQFLHTTTLPTLRHYQPWHQFAIGTLAPGLWSVFVADIKPAPMMLTQGSPARATPPPHVSRL
jgi:hypothetical protein